MKKHLTMLQFSTIWHIFVELPSELWDAVNVSFSWCLPSNLILCEALSKALCPSKAQFVEFASLKITPERKKTVKRVKRLQNKERKKEGCRENPEQSL